MRTINLGDAVRIYYSEGYGSPNGGSYDEGVVMHIPQDTGDWFYVEIDGKEVGLNPMASGLLKIEVIRGNLE